MRGSLVLMAAVLTLAGCASQKNAGVTTTGASVSTESLRQLEAMQSRNPSWEIRVGDDGRVVAASRYTSVIREDIRPEVEAFFEANGSDLGLHRAMRRVVNEPGHVRYEWGREYVDARLANGAIVVVGKNVAR